MDVTSAIDVSGRRDLLIQPPAFRASAPGRSWAVIGSAQTAPERLREQWIELARTPAEPNAFAELWFAEAGLRNLAPAQNIRMVEVWSETSGSESLIGLMPLEIARRYGRSPVPHVRNWLHFHSFLGSPLVRAGAEQAFWSAVLAALDRDPWARGFLHVQKLTEGGPLHRGLVAAAQALGRSCDTVHRSERALLATHLSPTEYYERTVRKKKRKELKRLSARLSELGEVQTTRLTHAEQLQTWCDSFLTLERTGWKGEAGSALACSPETEAFFREAVTGAFHAGRLDMLRMHLDGQPIAMLVNFLVPPGSFSFKIAFDMDYARFSPGVLIQLDNYRVLSRADVAWMDSCAAENHPMINSLWAERRSLVQVALPLAGFRRAAVFRFCRLAEKGSATLRRLITQLMVQPKKADEDE
jgi:CelD/BcsL family acetyltransferase involved in cellulose biosynthesis